MEGDKIKLKIGFIGAGNMASAICEGMTRKGLVTHSQLYVSAPSEKTLRKWKEMGVNAVTENGKVAEEADVIFLAIKPHILPAAVADIYKTMNHPNKVINKLFVSILAGITLESLENVLAGFEGSRVIRVMPNTPMMVSEGCTVYCPGQNATEGDIKIVEKILSSSGFCSLVPESMMTGVGALAGSGPAFVYTVIEALSDGGVKMGLPRAMATQFAAQTVLGAAKMVLETGKHTGTLKDEVCSPGGTTIAGIHALERGGLRSSLMDAVETAALKSIELGQKHGKKNNHDSK